MREKALWLYRQLTRLDRNSLRRELRQSNSMPVAILFYHRVADHFPNDWTISYDNFRQHLDWLQTNFDVVSLAEAQRRLRGGNETPTVAITFDDGYADNADFAIPELHKRGLEATYFVSTNFTQSQVGFPHDLELGLELRPDGIEELKYYLELGMKLGAHTKSHCDCGKLTSEVEITEEISGSARQLERWLDIEVEYFAFPFGMPSNMTQAAVDQIAGHGFAGFCSAYGDWNWPSADGDDLESFHLRRIHADPGLERLKNWLTLDRRKLRNTTILPFTLVKQEERNAVTT